ncbi:MAG: DUF4326 domain-containing protein [Rhodovibrionaceae bacterium]|nr:DUF4326 domain-containing protein [Rhodovibrionaceae bacterium]
MQRHQFKRGRKLPKGVRFVARPSRWGNPYKIPPHTREEAMRLYRAHAEAKLREDPQWLDPLMEAEGLACYCRPDQLCHADVLIEMVEKRDSKRIQ